MGSSHCPRYRTSFLFLTLLFSHHLFAATTAPADPVQQRAEDVRARFAAPGKYAEIFHPSFRAAVPDKQLTAIFEQYDRDLGECRAVRIVQKTGALAAKLEFVFKSAVVPSTISVDPGEKHLINGLWVGLPTSSAATMDDVVKELSALPGTCSFLAAKLNGDKIEPIASLHPDQPLALGSAFKLYILAELMRQIDAGERHWEDVVKLDKATMSLPSGETRKWPAGSPVTLHTLAALMISQSDNTATDQLLAALGREKVESILSVAGNEHASINQPFLGTLEMFKLHSQKKLAADYLAADVNGRRKMLTGSIASTQVDVSGISAQPTLIDKIEWFASANDLCRTMNYLRTHSESGNASPARQILSINPGLDIDKSRYPYVGFKGGSEPGVLNLTFLVRSKKGDWYALAATWNNPKAAVKEDQLIGLVTRALRLLP